jgi:hypothetical protein
MCGRSRHQFGVLLVVLLVALIASGCGGGGDEEVTTTSGPAVTAAPSGPATGDSLVGEDVVTTADTPAEFVEAYGAKPIVVLFYVPGATDDVSVVESLDGLAPSFDDYLFLAYDYKTPDVYGDLSALLEVGYPPEVILIDKKGIVQRIWNGYVDEGTLNQGLVSLDRI